MAYHPQVDDVTTVTLPGEVTRAVIRKIISPTVMLGELIHFTTSKEHHRKKGDKLAFRLKHSELGQQIWEEITEAEIAAGVERHEREVAERVIAGPVPADRESVAELGSN